jgi:DNA-binding transcriptional LysR family regulator
LKGQLLHYRAQAWSAEACMRLIAGGLGVGFLPADVAGVQLDNLNLVAVPMSDPWSVRNIRICFKDEAMLSPASRLLVNHLTSRAACANPAWPQPL